MVWRFIRTAPITIGGGASLAITGGIYAASGEMQISSGAQVQLAGSSADGLSARVVVGDVSVSGNGVLAIDAGQNAPLIVDPASPLLASSAARATAANLESPTTSSETANDVAIAAVAAELDANGSLATPFAAAGQLTPGVSGVSYEKKPFSGG